MVLNITSLQSPTMTISGMLKSLVTQINALLTKAMPSNPNLVLWAVAAAGAYGLKSRNDEGLWYWAALTIILYSAMKYWGLGI